MELTNKQYANGESYRFGFNGKEKDDDISEGSLDFGARIYGSDIGRWFSVDPLADKNLESSPFAYVENSPIIYIDPDGRDNIVYLIYLGKEQAIHQTDLLKVQEQANNYFRKLGLKTQVKLFKPGSKEFDIRNLDNTDAVALLGSRNAIIDYVNNHIGKQDKRVRAYYSGMLANPDEFGYKARTPELSVNNGDANEVVAEPKIISVSLDAAYKLKYMFRTSSIHKVLGFLISHGAGHNSGLGHINSLGEKTGIMIDGSSINRQKKGRNLDDIIGDKNDKENKIYKDKMTDPDYPYSFGNNDPTDNYNKNKILRKYKKFYGKDYSPKTPEDRKRLDKYLGK